MDVRWCAALAWLLALGVNEAAVAETFRCTLADRVVSYQQTPCAVPELPPRGPGAQGLKAAGPAEPGLKAPAPTADAPFSTLTPRKREVLDLTARFERCRAEDAAFTARTEPLYQAWRRRHAATIAEHSRLLATKIRVAQRAAPAPCTDDWLRELEPLARTPDPRFSSVEKTWEVFVGGLRNADRAAILACVSGPVARSMADRLQKLADPDLRRIGADIRELKVLWGDDYDREAVVTHADRIDGVVFRKNVNEEWKLREMKPAAVRPVATPRKSSPDS